MNYLNLLNNNIIYLYIDLFNFSDKSELEYNILFEIENIIENHEKYFLDIIQYIYENHKNDVFKENIYVLKIINDILIKELNLVNIYNKLKKKNKTIIWNYLKIFIILYEKYYFTL